MRVIMRGFFTAIEATAHCTACGVLLMLRAPLRVIDSSQALAQVTDADFVLMWAAS
jgi:hypothetical protein